LGNLLRGAGEGQRLVLQTLTEDVREPRPVLVEETDHRAAHRLGQRLVFRRQHPAHTHAFAPEHARVEVGVGRKLGSRVGQVLIDPVQRAREALGRAGDQR
jgi:hypothetical protein